MQHITSIPGPLTDCFRRLDSTHQPELITILSSLLKDRSSLSIGSVAVAFDAVCPTRLDLLHQHYRRLCRTLVDADEWGQVDLMALLTRYARTMLPRPLVVDGDEGTEEVDADVRLLLTSAEPLFQSYNPAVRDGRLFSCNSSHIRCSTGCIVRGALVLLPRAAVPTAQDCLAAAQVVAH